MLCKKESMRLYFHIAADSAIVVLYNNDNFILTHVWRDLPQSPLFPCACSSMKHDIKQ